MHDESLIGCNDVISSDPPFKEGVHAWFTKVLYKQLNKTSDFNNL